MIARTLSRLLIPSVLIFSAVSSHAVVMLDSGQSYQTQFGLLSDGQFFLSSDYYWEADLQAVDNAATEPYSGTGVLTVTFFENIDFTGQVFTTSIDSSGATFGSFLGGSYTPQFSDLSGSLRIDYTGIGTVELQSITISNRAGTDGPFFNATTTFEPMASPVPWPPALALFLPGLLLTIRMAASARRAAMGV